MTGIRREVFPCGFDIRIEALATGLHKGMAQTLEGGRTLAALRGAMGDVTPLANGSSFEFAAATFEHASHAGPTPTARLNPRRALLTATRTAFRRCGAVCSSLAHSLHLAALAQES